MENSNQKSAFLDYEADAWFQRNKIGIEKYVVSADKVLATLQSYNINPSSVLEVGCSAGYRLNGLQSVFPGASLQGIEPSAQAIEYGRKAYPNVNFTQGTADNMPFYQSASFDLVIIGFVFYVVDRALLLQTVAEIDRVLQDKGILIIIDFFTEIPAKRKYHHIDKFEAYSFKQNYEQLFAHTGLYNLLSKNTYDDATQQNATDNYQNLVSISVLKKDLHGNYK